MVQPLTGRIIPWSHVRNLPGIHEIVAEHRSPFDSCTMTVGKMSAGDSANIIPETAIMQGPYVHSASRLENG